MRILLPKKRFLLSSTLTAITLLFSSLSFSYNPGLNFIPGRDDNNTGGIDESMQGCVYRESSGIWTVDDCDYVGAHNACYNGSEWRIAQALGTTTNPGEPRDGNVGAQEKSVDLWDPIRADNLCKTNFGPSYFFSVPVNAEEDAKLGSAMTQMIAAKKRTWLYYYSNTDNISLSGNYWLGNRTEYTNLLGTNLGNTGDLGLGGVADCTLINRDTGLWQDAPCSEKHSFACYDSGAWLITENQDGWKSGFSSCESEYGLQTLYAVPRDASENNAIAAAALPSGGTGIAADYNKVWLNRSDLAFEEFFISNQTRQSWWGIGQPTNRGNADCAVIDSAGNWIAESCNGYVAYHACYLGNNQWQLTSDLPGLKQSESALGFGLCKRLSDNAQYRPPSSAASNNALALLVDALPENKFVWINYSDQASEGYWKAESPFVDFVNIDGVVEGDAQDCGYFSLDTDNKKNWLSGQCYAGGAALEQGFACTNGYEWKIATEALTGGASLKSDLWKDGFTACEAAFGKDYEFAAPYDADQNSRLSLALKLSGNTQAWLNINDAKSEGEWVANGPVVNLSPVITSLSPEREFPEKTQIDLSVTAVDPEAPGSTLTYQWSIIDTIVGLNDSGTDIVVAPTLTNANTPNVTISPVDLINDDYYIDLQLQITDADPESPATTTIVLTLKIISPLLAAYDFNTYTNPALDKSGNGHNLTLNTSEVEITPREDNTQDYFAKLDGADSFSLDGSANGVSLDSVKDQYTLIYRFRLDTLPVSDWAGFVQKGNGTNRQPALFFNKPTSKIQLSNLTDNSTESELNLEAIRLGQWVTVAYVKDGSDTKLYVDKAELKTPADPTTPVNLNVIPDTTRTLLGNSTYNSEDWTFGNVTGASEGIAGGFDDIRIYDRALTAAELAVIFPEQPRGVFEFVNEQESGDENSTDGAVNELLIPVKRIKGDDGEVSVGFKLVSDSAILDTDFRLKDDTNPAPTRGEGVLSWGVHDVAEKNITVELIGDTLREGTETFKIDLVQLATEPGLGLNTSIDVNIIDKTPNPYGAIGIAPTNAVDNIAIDEGDSGVVTIERVGSDSLGAFDVLYEVKSINAVSPSDYSITQAGFSSTGATGENELVGSGRLSFADEPGQIRQTQTISFSTVLDGVFEPDELFTVNLLEVTDPGSNTLADPSTSAILATKKSYSQQINDITPGRISFAQASYSVNEKDGGAAENVTLVTLQRIDGDDGDLCVSLDVAGSATAADYTIDYLDPSTSGQEDVFWTDGNNSDKYVQITAVDDEAYDADETIELTWQYKASCSTATPDTAIAGDVATATVNIIDETTPVLLQFTQSQYSVSELVSGGKALITIQATQARMAGNNAVGDFSNGNRFNNNTFQVYLERTAVSATEGTHYGDLSSVEVITFNPTESEKTIEVPIFDNCDASASLTAGLDLLKTGPGVTNSMPSDKLDVSGASSTLAITNASDSINFGGITPDFTGVDARIRPDWKNDGRFYVTGKVDAADLNPEFTQMALKADVTHNCLADLQFNWNISVGATPLPSGNGLPANFSVLPVLSASSNDITATDSFKLPFVIKDTDLVVELSITDPETGAVYDKNTPLPLMSGLEEALTVTQVFRGIQNNGEGADCLDWRGDNDTRIRKDSCDSINRTTGIAYHPVTQQLVFGQETNGNLSCVSHAGGDDWLYTKYCQSNTQETNFGQRWSLGFDGSDGRVNSVDRPSIYIVESGLFTGFAPMASDGDGKTDGAKRWTWVNYDGTYLP